MPNSFRSGSDITITGSIFTPQFTIGINPDKVKGPTVPDTGFYRIPTLPYNTSFAIIAPKSTQGPSVRIGVYGIGGFNDSNDLQSIGKQYGAPPSLYNVQNNLSGLIKWFTDNGYTVINFDYGDIVTNGLIGLYDAGYVPSYPMSGSTIYDLSGKNANGTISTSSITFNSNYSQSSWDFRGATTGSYISTAVPQNYMDFTMVFQPTFNTPTASNSGLMGLFATTTPAGNADKSMRLIISGSGISPTSSAFTVIGRNPGDQNDWAYPSASTFYINGTSGSTMYWTPAATGSNNWICFGGARTNTTQGAFSGSFPIYIGSGGFAAENRNLQGLLGLVLFYDRALSAAEQLQNYNALKDRFEM